MRAQGFGNGGGVGYADVVLEIAADADVTCADGGQPLGDEFALREHHGKAAQQILP